MSQQYKKRHEAWIFERFKEAYNEFPKGSIVHDDSPDFAIQTEKRVIGIEIAHVYKDDIGEGSQLKQRESVQSEIGYKIIEKAKQYTDKSFALNIHFNYRSRIERARKREIIKECLKEVLMVVMNYPDGDYIINNEGQLPPEIFDLSIYIDTIHWNEAHYIETTGGVLGLLKENHLTALLNRHHEALNKYKQCNEYWLLIEEGSFEADSFGNIDIVNPLDSKFDKVFLYRINRGEVVCLK